tara:strand:+ start:30504 stop:31766 length:1263 start_codon:yes stop_codon:yes gene_type:complete
MDRRFFLRCSAMGLALPGLESIDQPQNVAAAENKTSAVKRFVAIGSYLGFHTPSFSPSAAGRDYTMSPVLTPLEDLRDRFSVFSGLDHRAPNGHQNWKNYLTGKGTPGISIDQMVANAIGNQTRFESLQVTCGFGNDGMMSFTKEGIPLPAIGRPSVLYRHLFSCGTDLARMDYLLRSGGSVLDLAIEEARALQRQVNARDAEKLTEYFSSVRDAEKKLQKQRDWLSVPTPQVDFELPEYDPVAPDLSLECESMMYDLMSLALQTDSTRVISFLLPGQGQVFSIDGQKLSAGYHGLSHHGNDPDKIAEFNRVGIEHVSRFGNFVRQLGEKEDTEGRPLVDSTAILFGSGMGDANTHNNSRLPILLAGGPYRHGSHHSISRDNPVDETPLLGDLFLTVMQSMGLEEDQFVKARRNLNEVLL